MVVQKKPNRLVMFLGLLLLLQFFGGGLAVFINLFFPFLGEAAFCIIALVLMAELVVMIVVGKCVRSPVSVPCFLSPETLL